MLVYTLAPEAEGHGTDSVIAAYHYHQGQIRPRVPLVKIVASALTLGTGGSGGREGPIAQIGAGFGSLLGNMLQLRPAERRVLMAAGMGAGIGAIFRAPLAGTIFAAEVLYSSPEFEPEVIIPAGIASVISYCVYGTYSGWEAPVCNAQLDVSPIRGSWGHIFSWHCSWYCWQCCTRIPSMASNGCLTVCRYAVIFDRHGCFLTGLSPLFCISSWAGTPGVGGAFLRLLLDSARHDASGDAPPMILLIIAWERSSPPA